MYIVECGALMCTGSRCTDLFSFFAYKHLDSISLLFMHTKMQYAGSGTRGPLLTPAEARRAREAQRAAKEAAAQAGAPTSAETCDPALTALLSLGAQSQTNNTGPAGSAANAAPVSTTPVVCFAAAPVSVDPASNGSSSTLPLRTQPANAVQELSLQSQLVSARVQEANRLAQQLQGKPNADAKLQRLIASQGRLIQRLLAKTQQANEEKAVLQGELLASKKENAALKGQTQQANEEKAVLQGELLAARKENAALKGQTAAFQGEQLALCERILLAEQKQYKAEQTLERFKAHLRWLSTPTLNTPPCSEQARALTTPQHAPYKTYTGGAI
jgi:hypothetical protein